jgi:hypothetical protein
MGISGFAVGETRWWASLLMVEKLPSKPLDCALQTF